VLARRINRADGSFAGTVHVAWRSLIFSSVFRRSTSAGKATAAYGRENADRPLQRGRSRRGEQRQGDAFAAIARTARFRPAECRLSRLSGIDGVSRIYRFHRIAPHELFLLVGLADEEILAEWKGNAAIILGLVLLFSISSLFARDLLVGKTRSGPGQAG
jgi:hypothetical protein